MKFRHLFGRDKVGIPESQLEQIPGKLTQRGHRIIHPSGFPFVLVKKAVRAGFIRQEQAWKLFLHMVLVMPEVPFLCVIYIPKAVLVCNEGIYFFGNG